MHNQPAGEGAPGTHGQEGQGDHEASGGWQKVERTHFARGAILEQIHSN